MTVRVAVAPTNCGTCAGADRAAHARPQAVGADERPARHHLAGRAPGLHVVSLLRERGEREAGAQRDARLGRGGARQDRVQIAAVRHPVGSPVPRRDPAPERQHGQRASGAAVMDREGIGHADRGPQRLRQPQALQHAHAVGPELNAGPGRGEAVALLEHDRGAAGLRQRQRQRQAADAAASDQDRRGLRHGCARRRQAQAAAASGPTRQPFGSVSSGARRASWT